jgi:hypothetical protein
MTTSLKESLTNSHYFSSLQSVVSCQCKTCTRSQKFQCSLCDRLVPYCYGAGDNYPDYCDDCACEAEEAIADQLLELQQEFPTLEQLNRKAIAAAKTPLSNTSLQ